MNKNDFDLTDPDLFVDEVPHDVFTWLRNQAPVHWHEEADGPGFWAVTRYDDVVRVNRDAGTFSSELGGTMLETAPEQQLQQSRIMMLNMDPPRHTKLRKLVNKGFTPRHVNNLEQHVRDIATDIIANVSQRGSCDFVDDIAAELPLQVIAEMMGVPNEDRRKIFDWSNRLIGSMDPEYQVTPEANEEARQELYVYAQGLAQQRREDPKDDIISALLTAEVDGERLSDMEFNVFFLLLAVAGNETTRNLVSHAMLALINNPEQYQKLVDNPSLIPNAVEEFLRWGTPVMQFRRTATKDTEVAGQPVSEGDKVVIYYISANRDERKFDDPFSFDVTRQNNEHIAFGGGGPHFCLGANLARLEIQVMFETLLPRLPDIKLAGNVERLRSNFINGIKHMPVEFTPAKVPAGV